MALGSLGVAYAAHHAGTPVSTWALVPGLFVAGAGLGFLVVPLVNVVLSAVGRDEAGEASGVFGTAQQFGGAVGVAAAGTVFFAHATGAGPDLGVHRGAPAGDRGLRAVRAARPAAAQHGDHGRGRLIVLAAVVALLGLALAAAVVVLGVGTELRPR